MGMILVEQGSGALDNAGVLCVVHITRHSLWDVSKGVSGLGHSSVLPDVLPCCILYLALLHGKYFLTTRHIITDYFNPL